jgi:hypothetical protein
MAVGGVFHFDALGRLIFFSMRRRLVETLLAGSEAMTDIKEWAAAKEDEALERSGIAASLAVESTIVNNRSYAIPYDIEDRYQIEHEVKRILARRLGRDV